MKIYLAGMNGIHRIVGSIFGGGGYLMNEDIPRREHDLSRIHRTDSIRGGGPDIDETISGKPAHPTKISERPANVSNPVRGGVALALMMMYLAGRVECARKEINATVLGRGRPMAEWGGYDPIIREHKPFILESFFYADDDTERLIPYYGDFLLDSGAYTFMMGKGGSPNWDEYVERYADFINRNKVEKYFELDIDVVVGYTRVKELRRNLERLTNQPVIPVWHVSRGLDDFKRMCDEYGYVAIGGIVSKEITPDKYGALPHLIAEAHKRNAKIHGLGFTALEWLKKCHFDSVDSTAWTTGNRFGYLYYFDGHTMRKKDVPKGHRLGDSRAAALNNYTEWIKFQKWAETHL